MASVAYYPPRYLSDGHRLSQIWFNPCTILLLLTLISIVLNIDRLQEDIDDAESKALSACTKFEDIGSAMASMPYYLSDGINDMIASSVESAVNALVATLNLILEGVEGMVYFYINFLVGTYACLLTALVKGSLDTVASATEDASKEINEVIDKATKEIETISDDVEKGINSAIDGVKSLFSSGNDAPTVDFSSPISELRDFKLDAKDFAKDVRELNNKIPSFDEVQNMTKEAISIPFDSVRETLNNKYKNFEFDSDVFSPAKKESLSFCSDNDAISSLFNRLREIVESCYIAFVVVLVILAIVAIVLVGCCEKLYCESVRGLKAKLGDVVTIHYEVKSTVEGIVRTADYEVREGQEKELRETLDKGTGEMHDELKRAISVITREEDPEKRKAEYEKLCKTLSRDLQDILHVASQSQVAEMALIASEKALVQFDRLLGRFDQLFQSSFQDRFARHIRDPFQDFLRIDAGRTQESKVLLRWLVVYATSTSAIAILSLGLTGLLFCLFQYVILRTIRKHIPSFTDEVEGFAQEVIASLESASKNWAEEANGVMADLNDEINHDILSYVQKATASINDTLEIFTNRMDRGLQKVFGDTVIIDPIRVVVHCTIGSKIENVQDGLTWVHDHANITLPRFASNIFSQGAQDSIRGDSKLPDFLLSSPGVTADEISGAVVHVIDSLHDSTLIWVLISMGILLLYVIIVLIGGVCAFLMKRKASNTHVDDAPEDRNETGYIDSDENAHYGLEAALPEKILGKRSRGLRYHVMIVYRRLFLLVGILNIAATIAIILTGIDRNWVGNLTAINLVLGVLVRQEFIINALYMITCSVPKTWPLAIRKRCAKIYHLGGVHSGAGVSAALWLLANNLGDVVCNNTGQCSGSWGDQSIPATVVSWLLTSGFFAMLAMAYPTIRKNYHDQFERTHRFLGWTMLGLFWIRIVLTVNDSRGEQTLGQAVLRSPPIWLLVVATMSIASSWFWLKKVPVEAEVLSDHAVRLHFDYTVPVNGSFTRISLKPLVEWHSFATIPAPQPENGRPVGYSLVVSNAGDWTKSIIQGRPTHLWVRGVPTCGVMRIASLFNSVVVIATGSGIGPLLGHIQSPSCRTQLIWSTPKPEKTFGNEMVRTIKKKIPGAVIHDTKILGRPDLVKMGYNMVKGFGAEAVIIIANEKITKKVVYGLETRGVPAYGAIWDS